MKKLGIVLSVCLAGAASARAEAIRCEGETANQAYLLVTSMKLGQEKAAIFAANGSNYEIAYANASIVVAQSNPVGMGPIHINGRDTTPIDWSKEQSCYKFRPGLSFTLHPVRGGGYTGESRLLPIVETDPARSGNCSIPRPIPPRPVNIKCDTLK